jgi:hypothetical protein
MVKIPNSAFVKNLVQRNKLIQHYESAWTNWDGPLTFTYESKETDDAFHPSGDCTPSPLQLYSKILAKMAGENPDPISPTLRKTFLVGHFWHQVYQDLTVKELGFAKPEHIERSAMTCWAEDNSWGPTPSAKPARAKPYHWARGSADIAPCSVPRYGDFLVDFKTQNSRSFNQIKIPDWCIDKWECQLNIYMDWFNLEKALIVCINKDAPHDLKEWEFHYNEPLVNTIYDKWKFVGECLDSNETPSELDTEMFDLDSLLMGPVCD